MKANTLRIAALAGLCAVCASVTATAAEPWSLDSCISYAVSHNITVKQRAVAAYSAELDITEAKDRFLPSVSGNASQSFNFGRGLTSENTYANRNTSNFSIGAGMQLPLFQGLSAVRRVSYAKASLRTAIEQLEAEKENVELNVISQYLQVLYAREVAEVAREQLRMSEYELGRRRQLVEGGKLPELDLYEAESQVASDRLNVTTSANDLNMALLDLSQLLELPTAAGFDIEPLEGDPASGLTAGADDIYATAMATNHTIAAGRAEINAADRQISLAKTGWIPTLSFSAGLNSSYYKLGGMVNPSFGEQMKQNFNKYVGFTLSVPIFDAFSTRNSVRKARVSRLNAQLALDQQSKQLYKAISQAWTQARGAEQKLLRSRQAVEAAEGSFRGVTEKYNYGRATTADYEQARSTLLRARLEEVQAKYELMLRQRILDFYNGGSTAHRISTPVDCLR